VSCVNIFHCNICEFNVYFAHKVFKSYKNINSLLDFKVRLVTLELTIKLLTQLAVSKGQCLLCESYLVIIEAAKEQSTSLLKNFYKVCDLLKLDQDTLIQILFDNSKL